MVEEIDVTEESFAQIVQTLSQLIPALKEQYSRAVKGIAALSTEWDDDDHRNLLNALHAIQPDLEHVIDTTQQLSAEAQRKLDVLHARRNIKM